MIPRKARRDSNEKEIIDALHQVGASIQPLSLWGGPDLLVGFRGQNYTMEIKTTKGEQREVQRIYQATWNGQYAVVRSVSEALQVIGIDAALGIEREGGKV